MPNCTMCGSPIPNGQRVCSMCYGDPYYGRDGYYMDYLVTWAEEEYRRQQEREQEDVGN